MSDGAALPAPASAMRLPQARAWTERPVPRDGMLDRAMNRVVGLAQARLATLHGRRYRRIAALAALEAPALAELTDEALAARIPAVARRLRRGESPEPAALAAGFALIREFSGRLLGQPHYPVQIMGAAALFDGRIAQMATGEGKTLTAALAAATAALAGIPVHVVTVNAYLAERDAEAMGPLYRALGLTVGVIREKQELAERAAAYGCDITYCTNKDLTFDYLRDRITLGQRASDVRLKLEGLLSPAGPEPRLRLRGLHFAIVDEADSVLIDEARTPLIISAEVPSQFPPQMLGRAFAVAQALMQRRDYLIVPGERRIVLLPAGLDAIEAATREDGPAWRAKVTREELVRQALTALYLFHRDEHYILREGKVVIVDEYTGRVMPDRSWSDGLHQMIEHKEGCALSAGRTTLARITYQRFFRRYRRLAGMTGTAGGIEAELWAVFGLAVARIPTHRPIRRRHLPDLVLADTKAKWRHVIARVGELHRAGVPVLIGTRSVAAAEEASGHLAQAGLDHRLLSAAQDKTEADIVAQAGAAGRITVATNMAGRGTDIKLAPGVAESGGLHVIMIERHDARRIDDQLAGRSGRQGEPGCFQAILSLDDPLLDGRPLGGTVARLALATLPALLAQPLARAILSRAQAAAERLHARMRRELMASDLSHDKMLAFSGHSE
ncbi:preprotein translocase subunit SecA [Bosea sp. (in: a-proteobacteria)]|uniref:preprotein translocase subunit SecA n=1 Tax=Bosea sp. (in: a-proteobacteria) TaxID=1871050 RepID=UPI003B3A9ABB